MKVINHYFGQRRVYQCITTLANSSTHLALFIDNIEVYTGVATNIIDSGNKISFDDKEGNRYEVIKYVEQDTTA